MNHNILLAACLSCSVVLAATAQNKPAPAIPRNSAIEQRVESLLKKMSLDEKIGQMTELTIDVITRKDHPASDFQLDEAMLDTVIGKYKVGSILNVPDGIAQTPEKWQQIITRIQQKSMEAIGIPCIYGVDQIHGASYTQGATFFPQGINMAATFNRALVREGARISAYETKAGSIPWTYAPVLDLGRDARWPRMWENYGEDAYLNAQMGRQAVLGFQGDDPNHIGAHQVAACLKHYMGYGVPVSGKDRTPSSISPQEMREKHFAPFLAGIRAGALSVMVNSAMNNGMPFHANYELLTEWLKNDLQWDGLIVTDWADIDNLYKRDRVAADKKEAIKLAINAGIDMSMDPYSWDFCIYLKQLVEEGAVKMSRIDDAVRRVLRMKLRLGLFETPYYNVKEFPEFGSTAHAAAARQAATESMVLLKNQGGILPLPVGKKLLLTGPNAHSMRTLNGGWSYSWQGDKADACAAQYHTILEAFTARFGAEQILYEPGVTYQADGTWWEENTPEIEKAVTAAAGADYLVVCIGENSYCETPGNLTDLHLSAAQRDLVKALAATGKPLILVLNEGRPRILSDIEPLAAAVVHIMLPGNYGGEALAALLAGDANFSGKLPFTYPKEINSLVTYDYKPSESRDRMEGAYNYDAVVSQQWAFGYGLSYTTFAYSNLRVDKPSFGADDRLTFSVEVRNTGGFTGKESVLLFSSDLVASLTPDNRRLRAFEKIELAPGEQRTVTLTLSASDLAFVGHDGRWILEAGDFRMQAGSETLTIRCVETKRYNGAVKE
ncbi:MAG: glycoside hydrolase family 3 C-terminal domain-containing protein [Prevotellaceae bacterium]|nr:glycoside hydrolase family 3 C-terminal domain-containing protein [Prevotellaceae bacterium]